MAKRLVLVTGAVIYLVSFLIGLVIYFNVEGSFPLTSRYFWAYTGLPALWLLAHLAAGVLLLRKPDRAVPLVLLIEVAFLAWAVTGAVCFWQTFNLILLAELLRAALTGLAIYWLWWPLEVDRPRWIAGAGAGLLLAVTWTLTLQPIDSGSTPLLTGPGVPKVWQRPPVASDRSSPIWKIGLPLANDGQAVVHSSLPAAEVRFGGAMVSVYPLPRFPRLSLDGLWATRLNAVGMGFHRGTNQTTWADDGVQYAYVRYNTPRHVQSRLAGSEALNLVASKPMSADLYARVDPDRNAMDLVAVTYLRTPIYASSSLLFEIMIQPCTSHRVVIPGLLDTRITGSDGAEATDPWLVNLQADGAAVYRCSRDLKPRSEEARADTFPGWLAVEDVAPGKTLVVRFPDWQTQALRDVSPAAGSPIAANHLLIRTVPSTAKAADGTPWPTALSIEVAVAATDVGSGAPPVLLNQGTYVNRMCMQFVPTGSDYEAAVAAMKPWPLPDWTADK
jgi:hypothetical protein